ncbi:MAG: diguanylate cyclase [Magnetococcales bacterium]|nr:diguanylate cyclase [Magnetococcales bacterium]HIJ83166.1 dihydroorotate dehydrogenase [Magnetococcales bacterium]
MKKPPDVGILLAGVPLASPVTLLSGCVGFCEDLARIDGVDFSSVGAVFLKGTTLEARLGNPPPRVVETHGGMLNAIGLQNPGARHVVQKILPAIQHLPTRFFANIAGSTVDEYGEVARIFDNSPIDGIEINISCPNVKEGGAAFGSDPLVAARVVETVKRATSKPVITKLSPNVTDIALMTRAVIDAGTDAISAINTLMGLAIDLEKRQPVLGNGQGGLSGPAIKPVALLQVWRIHQIAGPRGIPIIGQGGITTARDAMEFVLAGATAIGLGTALFRNPLGTAELLEGMVTWLRHFGVDNFSKVRGTLNWPG